MSRTKQSGFTFIEMLVVSVLISVLAAIIVVSFMATGRFTRDARRKRDIANLQVALEQYKRQFGEYPESSDCGGDFTWPGCTSEWIPGIVPDFATTLPTDPKQNYTGEIGNLTTETYTYNYTRPTTGTYHFVTRLENSTDNAINGDDFGYSGTNIYVVAEPK